MPRLSKEKIEHIYKLAKSGQYTYKSIAEQVGCTAATAKKYAEQVKNKEVTIKKQPSENPSLSLKSYDYKYSLSPYQNWPAGALFISCSPKFNLPYTAALFNLNIKEFIEYCVAKYGARLGSLTIDSNSIIYFYDKDKCMELINELNRRIDYLKLNTNDFYKKELL